MIASIHLSLTNVTLVRYPVLESEMTMLDR